MYIFRKFSFVVATLLGLGLSAHATAGVIPSALHYSGTTAAGSDITDNYAEPGATARPIAVGTAWTLDVYFDASQMDGSFGVPGYYVQATSAKGTLNGSNFTLLENVGLGFTDPTYDSFNGYTISLYDFGSSLTGTIAFTTSSTAGWSASSPNTTAFSNYTTHPETQLLFSLLPDLSPGGSILNIYVDPSTVTVSLTVVPEPGTLVMGGLLAIGGGFVSYRKVRRGKASA